MPLARLTLVISGKPQKLSAQLGSETVAAEVRQEPPRSIVTFDRELKIAPGQPLEVRMTV
jgi:hypothetical protein